MIDTLLTQLKSFQVSCLEIDRLIDRLNIYIPDGDEDYFGAIEENKKLLKQLNNLIASLKIVREKIN